MNGIYFLTEYGKMMMTTSDLDDFKLFELPGIESNIVKFASSSNYLACIDNSGKLLLYTIDCDWSGNIITADSVTVKLEDSWNGWDNIAVLDMSGYNYDKNSDSFYCIAGIKTNGKVKVEGNKYTQEILSLKNEHPAYISMNSEGYIIALLEGGTIKLLGNWPDEIKNYPETYKYIVNLDNVIAVYVSGITDLTILTADDKMYMDNGYKIMESDKYSYVADDGTYKEAEHTKGSMYGNR